MRDDFCAFILTHGRPDRVDTLKTLEAHGYTGPVYLVCDDEDSKLGEYRRRFGRGRVLVFSKAAAAKTTDVGDNFPSRGTVTYARNVVFDLARRVGHRYFVQLDDDYEGFYWRFDDEGYYGHWRIVDLDVLFDGLVDFLSETPFGSVAISQGGDHIGGGEAKRTIGYKRKVMNTFVCDSERPFPFMARGNDDVTTYTVLSRRGIPFLTFLAAQVNQRVTQSNPGGLTEMYLAYGTYVKSFYTVMFAPSCTVIAPLHGHRRSESSTDGKQPARIHHRIDWNAAAPRILPERFKKGRSLREPSRSL